MTTSTKIKTTHPLTKEQLEEYNENGYVIVKGFFSPEEMQPIADAVLKDPEIRDGQVNFRDANGHISRMIHWTKLGDSLLSVIPRMARIVDASETLFGGAEAYHWHSKLVQKTPHAKGKFGWHQLFGGVYQHGVHFPDDISAVVISVTPSTVANGCINVVKKSHKLGRLDTEKVGDAILTNLERMGKVLEKLEVVPCETEVGDALFMHSNTLHASQGNTTDTTRINMIIHHIARTNQPYIVDGKPPYRPYVPVQKLPDSAIVDGMYDGILETQEFFDKEKAYNQIIQKKMD